MKELMSVIIPVYNRAALFQKALQSVYEQTYRPLEVMVIDDGSVEDIEAAMLSIPRPSDIAQIFKKQKNQGAPLARNAGFEQSSGEFVIFWDADITADTDMLQKMYDALITNQQAAYAYSDFYFGKKKMPAQIFDAEALRKNNYITTTSLIHREAFPGFDPALRRFQDWDLWLTMLEQKKEGVYVPGFLFRIHTGGTMSEWLHAAAYKKPWRWIPGIAQRVQKYESAKKIVQSKHGL